MAFLQLALAAAQAAVAANPARSIDLDQIRVELTNAQQRLASSQSGFRRDIIRLKSELNLPEEMELTIDPVIELRPVQIDVETAVGYARNLAPRLRQLDIQRRETEIRLDQTKGNGGFQVDLEFTYGREMRDPVLRNLWEEPTNAYTVDVNASIPIWDWGQRRDRIAASEIDVRRNRLQIEQAEKQLRIQVENEIANVVELQERVLTLRDNLTLAADISRQSLERYRQGQITALDMLNSMRRESDTANSFLQSYNEWRRTLQSLQDITYWDFETNQPVDTRFGLKAITEGAPQ